MGIFPLLPYPRSFRAQRRISSHPGPIARVDAGQAFSHALAETVHLAFRRIGAERVVIEVVAPRYAADAACFRHVRQRRRQSELVADPRYARVAMIFEIPIQPRGHRDGVRSTNMRNAVIRLELEHVAVLTVNGFRRNSLEVKFGRAITYATLVSAHASAPINRAIAVRTLSPVSTPCRAKACRVIRKIRAHPRGGAARDQPRRGPAPAPGQ